jgi:DNA-binding response OmpR family regulator
MRLLIVEDEADLAQTLADGLRHEGFGVDVAGDGASALALLGTTDVDVVVLDRDLPVLHGDAVCRALVAAGHPARILMLTASGTLSDRVGGLYLGA